VKSAEALPREDRDFLHPLFKGLPEQVLESEMTEALGAGPGERTARGPGYRAGHYERGLVSRGTGQPGVGLELEGVCGTAARALSGMEFVVSDDRQGSFLACLRPHWLPQDDPKLHLFRVHVSDHHGLDKPHPAARKHFLARHGRWLVLREPKHTRAMT